jgi:putative ABC transport system substrate-binding protein
MYHKNDATNQPLHSSATRSKGTVVRPTVIELAIVVAALLVAPLVGEAQQAEKVYRVGYLGGQAESVDDRFLAAFRQGMHRLGYVEGRNLVLVARFAKGQSDRFPALAQELVRLNPDVLFVATVVGIRAVKAATTTIPIVFVQVGDPVGVGLVSNLARPGGNLTGITNIAAELTGKRLELLKELVPSASRIAVLVNPDAPIAAIQIRNAEAAARTLGMQLQPLTVRDIRTLEASFEAAVRSRASAALRMVDFTANTLRVETAKLAIKHRLPVMYAFREDVDVGGLVAYGPSVPAQYEQAATFVHKILQGARPADLPVEQPTKFELVVNLKTAKTLGLTIPQSLLLRADQIIEQ